MPTWPFDVQDSTRSGSVLWCEVLLAMSWAEAAESHVLRFAHGSIDRMSSGHCTRGKRIKTTSSDLEFLLKFDR